MTSLESQLRNLPAPPAPASTTALVMAQVQALEAASKAASASPASARSSAGTTTGWPGAAAVVGAAAGMAAYMPVLLDGSLIARFFSPRIFGWIDGPAAWWGATPVTLLLVAGLTFHLIRIASPSRPGP